MPSTFNNNNGKSTIRRIISVYKTNGLFDLLKKTQNHFFPPKASCYKLCIDCVAGKSGLEIGGPSYLFAPKGLLPVYPVVKNLDNCNFSFSTLWEGKIEEGFTFKFNEKRPSGYQYISEAADLKKIPSDKYDFLLASHVIEHTANPIKALFEWKRILKSEGILVVVIPHKDGTFDHKRNITPISHLIDNYNYDTKEDDLTHLQEILDTHDLKRDPEAGTFEQFKIRSQHNFENRSLHHHVFNTYSAVILIDYLKLKILTVEADLPFHIIIVAKKTENYNNKEIISKIQNKKIPSPFISDK
jgi:SAM-dependent methyltransferase